MVTARERVQLMLNFAQNDLEPLRAGDWLNLREDLEIFILGKRADAQVPWGQPVSDTARIRTAPLLQPSLDEMTPEAFQALQAEVRDFFDSLIPRDKRFREHTRLGEASVQTGPLRVVFERRGLVTVMGPAREATLLLLGFLLGQLPPDALSRCPECEAIFFRTRKQRYCIRRCVNRVNQRTARAKKGQTRQSRQPTVTP
jgi:hypothetical protein